MGNVQVGQPLQIGLEHLHLRGLGLAHHDGGVDTGKNVQRVLEEFDGTGAVQESETLVEIRFVVAQFTSTLICRARASTLASPTVFFCATAPLRCIAPVANRMLSSNVVLPLP